MKIPKIYSGEYLCCLPPELYRVIIDAAELGTCDDVLTLISGKEYRRTAFINFLNHENYISPIIKACYN